MQLEARRLQLGQAILTRFEKILPVRLPIYEIPVPAADTALYLNA
jgi:hypothetical protein